MKSEPITKEQYDAYAAEMQKRKIDVLPNNYLATISQAGRDFRLLIFESIEERNTFFEGFHMTVRESRRDRGIKGKVSPYQMPGRKISSGSKVVLHKKKTPF